MSGKIKELRVYGYQSNKKVEMELGNVTVITGNSRSGKSAFFRAIKGAVQNEDGNEYITVGEKITEVVIDDGRFNTHWIQSDKMNEYRICKEGEFVEGDGIFKKCGRSVPEAVQNVLNMGEIEFSKDLKENLNFYDQLGNIFIIQGKGSDNAKIIGSIFGVEKVYNGLREAEKDTKQTKKALSEAVRSTERAKEELDSRVTVLNEVTALHAKLELIYKEAKELDEYYENLMKLTEDHSRTRDRVIKEKEYLFEYKQIDFEGGIEDIDYCSNLIGELSGFNECERSFNESAVVASRLSGFDFDKILEGIDRHSEMKTLGRDYDINSGQLSINKTALKDMDKKIEILEAEINSIDVCETCGAEKQNWKL